MKRLSTKDLISIASYLEVSRDASDTELERLIARVDELIKDRQD